MLENHRAHELISTAPQCTDYLMALFGGTHFLWVDVPVKVDAATTVMSYGELFTLKQNPSKGLLASDWKCIEMILRKFDFNLQPSFVKTTKSVGHVFW